MRDVKIVAITLGGLLRIDERVVHGCSVDFTVKKIAVNSTDQ